MVTIIDYGIGNLRSIEKAFEAVGAQVLRTDRVEDIEAAERLVLPGVGAFGACAAEIRKRGLEEPVREAAASGKPFLGVCVGMQLLFDEGLEMGRHKGLGILPGQVVRFDPYAIPAAALAGDVNEDALDPTLHAGEPPKPLKVPHMGWNTIAAERASPLLAGLGPDPYFYFVHSFHADPADPADVIAHATYGVQFPAIVGRRNVFGVQFHPEKSQQSGLEILRNFSTMPV